MEDKWKKITHSQNSQNLNPIFEKLYEKNTSHFKIYVKSPIFSEIGPQLEKFLKMLHDHIKLVQKRTKFLTVPVKCIKQGRTSGTYTST